MSYFEPDDHHPQDRIDMNQAELTRQQEEFEQLSKKFNEIEHDRRIAIERALAAQKKFQTEIENLLKSTAYEFIQQQFEQSDIKQFNRFYRMLREASQNPSLINIDNRVNLHALLATPFGRELLEHDHLLETPIILFLCGFFIFPNFCHQYRFHFISHWNYLRYQLNIRTFDQFDMIIYCPKSNPFDCCLLFIENQPRAIFIHLFNLQQDMNINSLMEIFDETMHIHIVQKQLAYLDGILSDIDPQIFGFACLLYFNEEINRSKKEIYDEVKRIFNQLKQYVEYTILERKPLTKFLCKQFNQLQKILIYSNNTDPWISTIEHMWNLIKSYQNTFSSNMVQKISQELEHSIQSIQPTDRNHRLILLAYLQSFANRYNCIHLINEHLRGNDQFSDLGDYQLLFDFIDKSISLLKLIVQHLIFSEEDLADELYRYTPQTIAFLEHLFHSTLTSIDIIDGRIEINVKQSLFIFEDFQKKLDEYLNNLRLPVSLLSRYGLINYLLRVAPLFAEQRHIEHSSSANANPLIHIDPKEFRKKTMQNQINLTIEKLTDLLSRASQLPLRPHPLIERLHRTIHQLKTFDIEQESETSYRWLLSEEQTLTDLFNRFTIEINQYTRFHAPLPDDRSIHQLNEMDLEFTRTSNNRFNSKSNLQNFRDIIRRNSAINHSFSSLNQLIRLTHVQIRSQTWIRAISLLLSNNKDQLRTILMILNDDLAMQFERTSSDRHIFEDQVISTYAQYRCELLQEENHHQMISNYIDVAHLTRELHQWMNNAHLNVFNLFEMLKKLHDELHLSENQLRNFPRDSTCHFLPIDLRPEDLLCFFAPEYTSMIQMICSKFTEIDLFLSCRLNKIEPIYFSTIRPSSTARTGLSSYVYHHENISIAVFDQSKHIYYIVEGAIHVIQQLIHLLIDPDIQSSVPMKISMSVKELFPIHIALSLTLLILIDWTGANLVDFRDHQHLLKLSTLKTEENQLVQLKRKLHQMEEELNKIQRKEGILLETKLTAKRHEIFINQQQLEELTKSYREEVERQQQQWLIDLFNYFSRISQIIQTFLINLGQQFRVNFSGKIDYSFLLNIPIIIARQSFLEPFNHPLEHIENLQTNILEILNDIHQHAQTLIETDPIHSFLSFYDLLIRLSLSSLVNSTRSWKHYSQSFRLSPMKMKENLSQLNLCTRKQCSLFLTEIRTGYEPDELIKHARHIHKFIRNDLRKFTQNNQLFHEQVRPFERFIYNFIRVGYRYVQLQRGDHSQTFEDLFIDIPTDLIDWHLPDTEMDLLNLLDRFEMQLKSHCDSLFYLPFHLAFTFNSNPFHIFDQLQYSLDKLVKFVLPTAFMIERTWLTIDQLIDRISPTITEREYLILDKLCRNFLKLTNSSNEIDEKIDFLSKRFPFDLLESISKHLDDLSEILLDCRSKMIIFCQDLHQRWHLTMKEIVRGFLQGEHFSFPRHQRSINIEGQLLLGGIDQLQIILLKMPIEQMHSTFFFKLFRSTREIYAKSERILLKDFIPESIVDLYELLEEIYRQEYRIYEQFSNSSRERIKENYHRLFDVINYPLLIEQIQQANEQWLNTGKAFVELRSRFSLQRTAQKLSNVLSFLAPSSSQPIDPIFVDLFQRILRSMQSQQQGNRQIFTAPEQDQFHQIMNLYQRHRLLFHLSPLDEQLFRQSDQIVRFDIERLNPQLKQISVKFLNLSDPILHLKLSLNNFFTQFDLVVNTRITHVDINGNRMDWSTLIDQRIPYHIDQQLKFTCEQMYSKYYYIVNGIASELNLSSVIPSRSDIQNNLRQLEEEIHIQYEQYHEDEIFQSSIITQTLMKLSDQLKEIKEIVHCPEFHTNIYQLFLQLPKVDLLKKTLNQLSSETFASISPLTQIVHDDDPALWIEFNIVQTTSMNRAFLAGRRCLIDAMNQLHGFINHLQLIKAQIILSYAWTHALLTTNESSNTEEEFCSMLKEYDRFREIPMRKTKENIRNLHECRRAIKDARRVDRTIKQISNKWTEIQHLMNLSPFAIEENLHNAFLHSTMSRDAHLWLIETKDHHHPSTNLTSYPQTALLDFGSTLGGIHRRLSQRLFIHNHTERDLNVKIDRNISMDSVFDVKDENLQVTVGQMSEFEIFFRPPSTIGSFSDIWNLLIDNTIKLSNVLRLQTEIVQIDIEQSARTIDFGLVACSNHRIEKSIELKNVLPSSVRIKSQIQTTEINHRQSHLLILTHEFELPSNSIRPFEIALIPTDHLEEDIDTDICLAIDSAKNLKWIKVLARIRRTHLFVVYQGQTYIENTPFDRILINDFYPDEKRWIPLEFRNAGSIEYTLHLSSTTLKIQPTELNLVGNTTKTVMIEIQMSRSVRQEFLLAIDFLNNKRQCQLTFDCQTAQPQLTYQTRTFDRKHIIEIVQSAQMENIWNKDRQVLLPIDQEIVFTNASRAPATVNYQDIVSANDSNLPLNVQFHLEPNDLVIRPNSKESVRFVYQPIDLKRLDAQIQLQTNTSADPIHIPYTVEFHTPILQVMSHTLIDVGLVETGRILKKNVLMMKNLGQKQVRLVISESRGQKSFVKLALLRSSSTDHSIKIDPDEQFSFDMIIECEEIDRNQISEVIELAEFELTSLCDPVINLDSKLINRTITIVIIGHIQSFVDLTFSTEFNLNPWSNLRLLPSSWLSQICQEYAMHSLYMPLVMLTAIAHVCGSEKTAISLPTTREEWSTFCTNFHPDGSLTIDQLIDILIQQFHSSLQNNQSYFYHSSVFHRSFTSHETIRLQLYAVINTCANTDEAYFMQSYISKFWDIYERSTFEDAYQQAIEFVHQSISNDCAMPKTIRTFTKFLYQIVCSSSMIGVAQQLSTLIPSTTSFGELITIYTDSLNLKWTLLFTHVNDHTKEMIIRLIENDWQALLDLHLTVIQQQKQFSFQQSLLEAVKHMHRLWTIIDSDIKSNILTSLFADYQPFASILWRISDRQAARLNDLLSVTEMIFKRFEPSQSFHYIQNIFQETNYTGVHSALMAIPYLPKPLSRQLVFEIHQFRQLLTGEYRNPMISIDHIKLFCDILAQLLPTQWASIRKATELAYRLLCDASEKHTTLTIVINQSLALLDVLQSDKNWYSIQELYKRLSSTPTWKKMSEFIHALDCNRDIVDLTDKLLDVHSEETMIEILFQLCCLISTNDELMSINEHQSSIRQLSTNIISLSDFFEQIQSLVPSAMEEKIHAFLILLRLSSLSTLDDIGQSWLILFDITCAKTQRLFTVISSILSSFLGLLMMRDIPLGEQLYTTNLASALCILTRYRQNTRDGFITISSTVSHVNFSSILLSVRANLAKRTRDHRTPQQTTSDIPPSSTPTQITFVSYRYSDEMLIKMEISVMNYVQTLSRSSISLSESDTIHKIIHVALDTQSQVTQWYARFITFNILVHYRFDQNDSNHIRIGQQIVQYGLQLLRDLMVIRKILEPTFSHIGVQFLLKEFTQLEKCLLSLALEQYPMIRNLLRQLDVDVSGIKLDFQLPSHSLVPKGRSLNKSSRINSSTQSIDVPTKMIENSDPRAPISFEDWKNAMGINPNQQIDNKNMKKQEIKSKKLNQQILYRNLETSVRNFVNSMSDQNLNNNNTLPMSSQIDQSDFISDYSTSAQEVSINLQMKAMQQHLQKQPNLMEMYEKATEKLFTSTVLNGKLDHRSVLKPVGQQERWTYQLLVETPTIALMITLIVQEFRSHWEKLVNSTNLVDEHQIRWCILIDNSGSMSIHRNAIYEALVVIMELLRKLEIKFAVGRFGARINQKILKNLDDLFTNQDGQYVLEALTFDEGTYPATGLARIIDRIFPIEQTETTSNIIVHRLVLMITDGLTQERDEATYSNTISKYKINLGVMFIETDEQKSSQFLLRVLTQAQNCVLKANNIAELSLKIPQLMHEMIRACLTTTSTASTMTVPPPINIKVPDSKEMTLLSQIRDEKQKYTAVNQTSYTISSPTSTIPKLAQVRFFNNDMNHSSESHILY